MRGSKPKAKAPAPVAKPKSTGAHPAAPLWLNAFAQEEWNRVAPELHKRGKLTPDVEGTLENYCLAQATVRAAEAAIKKAGHFVKGKPNPALSVQRSAVASAKALAVSLEITPHKRKDAAETVDEWEGLLA
jgi:P27 family predicted phage terminase small subunit